MNRNKRLDSACSDVDNDYNLAEGELSKLQRQYRILECHHKAYLEESQNVIRKQRSHIDSLEKENAEVDIDLSLAGSEANSKKDKNNIRRLRQLVDECSDLKSQTHDEKDVINDLTSKVKDLESQVQRKHKTTGGYQVDTVRHKNTQKQKRVLENRLDKATVAFNATLTRNADLRERIEHLRQERALYDSLYRKLMKEQDDLKREMGEVIEESTHAYDARDEAHAKMASLRERSEKDQATYNMELKEIKRIILHEQRLKEFMNVKAQDRSEIKAIEAAKRRKKEEKAHAPMYAEEMEQFESCIEKVKQISGESSLDVIVHRFIQKEEENFALYNYVNELNSEVENIQENVQTLNSDIANFEKQGLVITGQRKRMMKELESNFNVVHAQTTEDSKKLKETNKKLDLMKSAIISVCNRIGCDDTSIVEKLGSSDGINDHNAMAYMGLIENLANEFMLILSYQKSKDAEESKAHGDAPATTAAGNKNTGSMTAARLRPKSVASVRIVPPKIETEEIDVGSDDLEDLNISDQQPLSREELSERLDKLCQKKARIKGKDAVRSKTPAAATTNNESRTPSRKQ